MFAWGGNTGRRLRSGSPGGLAATGSEGGHGEGGGASTPSGLGGGDGAPAWMHGYILDAAGSVGIGVSSTAALTK
jgi:hypothetical protein